MIIGYCSSATRDDKKILEQEMRILSASGKSREEVKFFCDNGVSGLMLSEKTALRGALEYVKRGEVEALYVTSAHVLGRNTTELIDIVRLCVSNGTELYIIDAGRTITSLGDAICIMMCQCVDTNEAFIRGARIEEGIKAKQRRGGKMNRELMIENGNYRGGKEGVCVKNGLGFITSLDFFQKLRERETLEGNRLSQMEIERNTGIPHIDIVLW